MNICHIYPVVFNIFNFCEKALISNCNHLWQFFCWNIYHQTCRCLFCLFTFGEDKKCSPVFNPWLSVLFNPWLPQGIYLHHSNPIVLKIPCAKFHASSCCQTKFKVEGQFCPPLTYFFDPRKDTHPMENSPEKPTKLKNSMLLVSNKQ